MLAAVTRHRTFDTAPPLPCHLPQKMSGHVWGALPPPLLTRPLQLSLAAGCVGGMSTGMAATRAPQLLQRRRQAGQVRRASPMLPTLPRWLYFLSRLSACTQLVRALCMIYSILVLCSLQDFTGRPLGPAHPRLLQTGWAAHPPAWRHSLAPSASSSGSASGSAGDNAISDNSSDTADDNWSLMGSWGWEGPDYVDNSWGNQDLLQLAGCADSPSHLESRINVGEQVEAYLAGLGIEQAQLYRLRLLRNFRPVLQQPVEQRAGVLFCQLMGLDLSAAEAARCFEFTHQPATSPSFEAAIGVVADLLAAGSKGGEGGRQLLGVCCAANPRRWSCCCATAAFCRSELTTCCSWDSASSSLRQQCSPVGGCWLAAKSAWLLCRRCCIGSWALTGSWWPRCCQLSPSSPGRPAKASRGGGRKQ